MEGIDEKDRRKFMAICIGLCMLAYFVAKWATTQVIAGELAYPEELSGQIFGHVYQPFSIDAWRMDEGLSIGVQRVIRRYGLLEWLLYMAGPLACYLAYKHFSRMTSHGTAGWAKASDIKKAGLSAKETGFVVGGNPFNHKLMLHNGPEHILLVAPTRSGKGVCNMVPTGICWKHSIFFFDPKGELWNFTASWRKHHLHQRVMKFEPLCKDGSAAKWNPFAEIDFQSFEELTDVS